MHPNKEKQLIYLIGGDDPKLMTAYGTQGDNTQVHNDVNPMVVMIFGEDQSSTPTL